MPEDFHAAMSRARDLVRAGKPGEATRVIQTTLSGQPTPDLATPDLATPDPTPDPVTRPRAAAGSRPSRAKPRIAPETLPDAEIVAPKSARPRRPLGDVVTGLTKGRPKLPPSRAGHASLTLPADARFDWHRIATPQGDRDYRLFIPATLPEGPQGLVLMLHGCTQDPDDFALGTGMNAHAETHGLIVAYPAQSRRENAQGCWNWFRPADQQRDSGEPAILAALARTLSAGHAIPPDRIFAAGLSAGGAMAAILGHTYPDVFSAVAIHSGLAAGSASDVVSAFAAMRGDARTPDHNASAPRTITFHGTADATVHPTNSDRIMASARPAGHAATLTKGTVNGRAFARSLTTAPDGTPLTEHWQIEGTGHAWSGGSPAGSYTDPAGPDATALMLAFFLSNPRSGT